MNNKVNLSSFTTENFDKGASTLKQMLWYFVNALLVRASWNPFMGVKIFFIKDFWGTNRKRLLFIPEQKYMRHGIWKWVYMRALHLV